MKSFKSFLKSKKHNYYEVRHGDSEAQVTDYPDHIELERIDTEKKSRNKGHASHVMDIIKKHADEHKKEIRLHAEPDEDKDRSKLEKFYKKHGFEYDKNTKFKNSGQMIRKPI